MKHLSDSPREKIDLQELRNYVFTYYPEFEKDPTLPREALEVLTTSISMNELRARFNDSFSLIANYTYSKAIDDSTDFNSDY